MRRVAVCAWCVVVIVLLLVLASAWADAVVTLDDVGRTLEPRPVQEDEPGWDCETMGNRFCGPDQ